ncbi:hypothetical protein DL96DRAFT_1615471 [Flagelloscypha sp. PMI_526]|nr:hypothetical protein DL96DRAFT_1615471 [Flagelloscypha sp. PMI_526]
MTTTCSNSFPSGFPSELLLLIFEHACEENRIRLQDNSLSDIPVLTLSHVCRSFRSLATSSWRLWSHVTIDIGEGIRASFDSRTMRAQFINIRTRLLPIFSRWLTGHPARMSVLADFSWMPSLDFHELFPASWKVSSLTVTADVLAGIIDSDVHLDEHIASLRIVETTFVNKWTSPYPNAYFTHLCNLEDVDMGPLYPEEICLPWYQLRVIRVRADLESIAFLATQCTQLASLTLFTTELIHSSNISGPITFEALTELRLWLSFDSPELLRCLHAPLLTTLVVHGDEDDPIFWPVAYDGLLKFLERSSPALEKFKLRGTHCSVAELTNLVGRMPHLWYLHFRPPLFVDGSDTPTANFNELATFLADSMNLPELSQLEVHGLPESSCANKLICSMGKRNLGDGNILRAVSLKVTKDFELDDSSERLIQEMRHQGRFIMIERGEEGDYDLW